MRNFFQIASIRNRQKVQDKLLLMYPTGIPIEDYYEQEEVLRPDKKVLNTPSTVVAALVPETIAAPSVTSLTDYFLDSEFISPNDSGEIDETAKANLKLLKQNVLNPAREVLGSPIEITSGLRSAKHNAEVGGATDSLHIRGEASDLTCENNRKLFAILMLSNNFDQLIWELNSAPGNIMIGTAAPLWIHVSHSSNKKRGQVLVALGNGQYRAMTLAEKQKIMESI